MLSAYLLIGQVLRPQGVRGQVKVRPDTGDPDRFEALDFVYIHQKDGTYERVYVDEVSVREDAIYLRLNGASTREEAEAQRNWMLYVDRAHARELAENETFICDLIGCKAVDRQGNELGTVTDVLQPGGNDVYVIQTPKGEMLLPALMHVVPKVDTANGRITINEDRLPEVAVCSWET